MQKPNNYDNVQATGDFTPLKIGGHILRIRQVEEKKTKTNKDMILIYLDTDISDHQPNYYLDQFKRDKRPDKKWGCIFYQLVLDSNGDTNKSLKTFLTSVEKSNNGFKIVWGDQFCNSLKGKLVGGVFGREEYRNNDGVAKMFTKCFYFRSVAAIKAGVNAPEDRLLGENEGMGMNGFINIPDGIDDELPFL